MTTKHEHEQHHDEQNPGSAQARPTEKITIERSVAGWMAVPADRAHHPLLARLFLADGPVASDEDLATPIAADSLAEAVARVTRVARDQGIGTRVCGDRRARPVVQMWAKAKPAAEPVVEIFKGLRGAYACHWGFSDLYDGYEAALRLALADGGPFTTGWFGPKKEIQSARVSRARRGGRLHLEVRAESDDWRDLADTAVWSVRGRKMKADSGHDTLVKLGFTQDEADAFFDEVVAWAEADPMGMDACRVASREREMHARTSYERLTQTLSQMADECEAQLERGLADLETECAARLRRAIRARKARPASLAGSRESPRA